MSQKTSQFELNFILLGRKALNAELWVICSNHTNKC